MKKASDQEIYDAYEETKSVWKAANILGMCGQSVHERLVKMGVNTSKRLWTEDQIEYLKDSYEEYASSGRLSELGEFLGRPKTSICKKARELGLTNIYRSKPYMVGRVSERMRDWHLENEHPRGMLGKSHSQETKIVISEKSKKMWSEKTDDEISQWIWKSVMTRVKNGTTPGSNREKASWKAAWRNIGGQDKYYRSRWEANYARYLEHLKVNGYICNWEHEPETFWFYGIKRGCVSYLPDFRVTHNNGDVEYHEVKGWMDSRSKTKLKRMAKYHPDVTLILIDSKSYRALEKEMSSKIDGWET